MASETEIPRDRVYAGDICAQDTGDLRRAMEGAHALVVATSAAPKLKASSLFGVRAMRHSRRALHIQHPVQLGQSQAVCHSVHCLPAVTGPRRRAERLAGCTRRAACWPPCGACSRLVLRVLCVPQVVLKKVTFQGGAMPAFWYPQMPEQVRWCLCTGLSPAPSNALHPGLPHAVMGAGNGDPHVPRQPSQ